MRFQSERTDLRVEKVSGQLFTDLRELTGRNLVGPISLDTRSRDIQLEDFTGELKLAVDRGDITLRPAQATLARIEARTGRGKIELALPDAAKFQLRATTEQGEVYNDFGPALKSDSEGRRATLQSTATQGPEIVLTTDRGSITVRKDTGAPLEGAPKSRSLPEEPGRRPRVEKY